MIHQKLDVYLRGKLVGHLFNAGSNTYTFTYDPAAEEADRLSASLPVRSERFLAAATKPFFEGLLPEERVRRDIARQLEVDEVDSIGLFAQIGNECAGAVSVIPAGQELESSDEVAWLNNEELEERIEGLPSFPLGGKGTIRSRASLAGAQRKMVAVVEGDRVGIPVGSAPSTHLLKPQWRPGPDDPQVVDLVSNEAFCMHLAKAAGCDTADVDARLVGQRWVLFVERFDRYRNSTGVLQRIHQEDIGQAAGILPSSKYEEDGGMSLEQVAGTATAAGVPGVVVARMLLDALVVSAAVGNADQHAKNLAILYSIDDGATLAPLYDVMSTLVYEDLSRRAAFTVAGETHIDHIGLEHCVETAVSFGMPAAQAQRRASELVDRLHKAVEPTLDLAQREQWLTPTTQHIADLVRTWPERCG